MHFDNLLGNRQSESRATLGLCTRAVHLVEPAVERTPH
jgi:hypothetical protein